MADFYNPQFSTLQTQMQQLQNILNQKPPIIPSPAPTAQAPQQATA